MPDHAILELLAGSDAISDRWTTLVVNRHRFQGTKPTGEAR